MKYKQRKINRIQRLSHVETLKCLRTLVTSCICLFPIDDLKNKLFAIYDQVHQNL